MGDARHPGRGGASSAAGPDDRFDDRFSERLWPSPAVWLLVVLGGGFGAATGYVGGPLWAVVGGVVLAAVVVAVTASATTTVSLSPAGVLRVGRAHVDVRHLTGAVAARGEEARALTGPLLDARTHLCLRAWVDPVVHVGLGDPDDPTPTWLFSTRRPEELVAALARHGVVGPVAVHRAPTTDSWSGHWTDDDEPGALGGADGSDTPGSAVPHRELGSRRGDDEGR